MGCTPDETRHLECREGGIQVSQNPTLKHSEAARGIQEYLDATNSYGVTFQGGSGVELVVYADADYAPKETKRKSVSGEAVMCGGTAIQWISRTQKCTTLSSSEAEYVAMGDSFTEALSCGPCGVCSCLTLGVRAFRYLRTATVRSCWRLTLEPTRTRNTLTYATTSCESMSRTESLNITRTVEVPAC